MLKQKIGRGHFTRRYIQLDIGGIAVGRPPFDPMSVLKIELVAYLYNLSKRQVEAYANENLPAKYQDGLAVGQKAPTTQP